MVEEVPTPPGKKVPTANISDQRYGANVELIKRLGNHSLSTMLSLSTEQDYESYGLAVRDAMDFNKKNTTLTVGLSGAYDIVEPSNGLPKDNKNTLDAMIGLAQVLDTHTLFTVNLTLGRTEGFLSDPYKVVELNGSLVSERRPDEKDKKIVYVSLTRFFDSLQGSAELGYRYYTDTFGIDAHTVDLAWYQKIGPHFVLRPLLRYYEQSAADFYAYRFTGSPEFFSSDYRVSNFRALGYGLKLIWMPNQKFSMDAGFERYEQSGLDGVTPGDAYPSATVLMVGARIWL